MRFSVLGPLAVIGDAGAELHLPQPRQRALMAVLLLHANQEISVSRLTESLWDADGSAVGPGALRTQIWALRKLLAPARRLRTGEYHGYLLDVRPGELDAERFRQLAEQGRQALGSEDLPGAVRSLTEALALWGEPPLADVPPTPAMAAAVQRLLDERAVARELLIEARLGLGQHLGLIPELRESTAADPTNERLWEQLMLALHGVGRTAEALAAYQQARDSMLAELGLEPGAGLRQLHRRILADDPGLGQRGKAPGGGNSARAGQRKAPSPDREHVVPRQLPAPVRPFVGREAELAELNGLLEDSAAAAVVISAIGGTAGVGKRTALDDLQQQILTGGPAFDSPQDPGPVVTVHPASGMATASAVDVRFSLPPDSAAFTGREAELDRIMATVLDRAKVGGVVAIYAIGGMPGVGKTALALHAAHVVRDQFPGRCLFIDLHAHTPGHDPVSPQAALARLLAAAGVEALNLPSDVEGRAALWRDKMAGQRALLVLDNAASSRQVAPLLPGGDGCLVLVTSRRHLADLPGAAMPLLLGTLPPTEARDMFARLAPRAAADPDEAVAELVDLAGYLPLAISLLARVYARHPSWTLANLVTETKASLLSLTAEDDSVAAAFDVSYRHLDPGQQQFFTLLGLHPGTTTDAYSAAAVAGTGLAEANRLLDGLHREGLLTETGHRRYGMHDLLRRYARDHAAALPAPVGERAVGRLLDYYQHAAALAGVRLCRQIRLGARPAEPAGPPAAPDLDDADRARAWAQAEQANLLACLDHVTQAGHHARVIALTAALAALLRYDGPWVDAIARHTTALQAAQRLGDRLGQARALNDLGDARRLTDDYPGAAQAQEQALNIYRDLGDRLGQANTLYHLGAVRGATGDYLVTAQILEQALGIYRDLGSRLGQASTLNYLGNARQMTGDYPGAAQAQEQALSIYRDLGDRLGQADALTYLGGVRRMTGDYPGAARALEQALSIFRDLGVRLGQGSALTLLGEVRRMTGDYPGAAKAQEQALSIFRDLGARLGQANALLRIGAVRRVTGDPGAARALERALAIYRDLGVRDGETEALNETGTLYRVTGNLAQAQGCHRQALELARAIASSWGEAHALAGLGRCALATADLTTAVANIGQAAEIFQQIGAAEASLIATELATLTSAEPATLRQEPRHGELEHVCVAACAVIGGHEVVADH